MRSPKGNKSTKKHKNPGRPRILIDWTKVDNYLKAQCDGVSIAGILGISPDHLYIMCQKDHKMGFSEYSAIKKGEGKELLRAKQFQVAMEGDKTMLVWLGKQYLMQKDKNDITSGDQKINSSITIELIDSTEKVDKVKDEDTGS